MAGGAIDVRIPWPDRAVALAQMVWRMQELEAPRKMHPGADHGYGSVYSMRSLGIGDGMASGHTTGTGSSGVYSCRPVFLGGRRTDAVLRALAERRTAAQPLSAADRNITRNQAIGRQHRYGHDMFPDYAGLARGDLPLDADEAPLPPTKNGWGNSAVAEKRTPAAAAAAAPATAAADAGEADPPRPATRVRNRC
eukprot:gene7631-20969_t